MTRVEERNRIATHMWSYRTPVYTQFEELGDTNLCNGDWDGYSVSHWRNVTCPKCLSMRTWRERFAMWWDKIWWGIE